MSYAEKTSVPVGRSKDELERLLQRYGATGFASGWEGRYATLAFKFDLGNGSDSVRAIRLRFEVPTAQNEDVRDWSQRQREQEERRIWRAALLVVKAKLESVESGIETFEQAWLSHIVIPGGKTVSEEILPRLAENYRGRPTPLLLGAGT